MHIFFFFCQLIFGIFFLEMMPLIQSRCIGHFANIVPISLHSGSVIFFYQWYMRVPIHHSITKKISDFEIFANLIAHFSLSVYQFLYLFFFFFWYLRLLELFSSSSLKQILENPLHVLWLRSLCASWIFGFMHSNSRKLFTVISINSAFSTFCCLPSFSSLSFN